MNKTTITRQQKIKDEIYIILKKEAHQWFSFIDSRENTLSKRLNSIEANGIPDGVLEDIKRDISQLKYTIRQQTKAIENLLSFFNASKQLLNMDENEININSNIQ